MQHLRMISLGAGVQSSTLYLAAVEGLLTPRPDFAVFADTQAEPPWVYEYLWHLAETCGDVIPIYIATKGDLGADVLRGLRGQRFSSIPARILSRDGTRPSLLRRNCTRDYKIRPIMAAVRRIADLRPRQQAKGRLHLEQWIGISVDEAHRMKPSRYPWVAVRYPLIELRWSRADCLRWLESRGHPIPGKSACYFCPYHDDAFWATLKTEAPDEFARAVAFDEALRRGRLRGVHGTPYLHRSLQPLATVPFATMALQRAAGAVDQLEMDFGNECEGMCGV